MPRPPVIGIDASRLTAQHRTGTEQYTLELLRAMEPHIDSDEIRLYLNSSRPPSELPNIGEPICIPARRFWTLGRLSYEMLRDPPDLLFVPAHIIPPVHPVSVMTVHDLGYLTSSPFHKGRDRLWLDQSMRASINAAQQLIAVSETTKRDLVERYGVPPNRVSVIYHGVRQAVARPGTSGRSATLERLGVTGPFVLAVGTVHPRKNYKTLIDAIAHLRRQGFPHDVVIAGKLGWEAGSLVSYTRDAGYAHWVHLLGYVNETDLSDLYASAQAVALPSFYEGFGLPALEAMGTGTPVVAANRGSLPEICGDAALYVDSFDREALARSIAAVLTDPALASNLIARGKRRAAQFTWDRAAKQTLALLRSIAGNMAAARTGSRER